MKKKFVVAVLSLVMCFAVVGVVAGCSGGGDTSALEARIAAVEQENQKLKDELNAIKGSDSSAMKTYKLGETATYHDNGVPMFSIKYVTKATASTSGLFTFTNINLPGGVTLTSIIAGRYNNSTNMTSSGIEIKSVTITTQSKDVELVSIGNTALNYNKACFYSPSAAITYAIFEL